MGLFRNHVRWVLIAWMFVISAVAYLDRVNISIAGSSIEQEFCSDTRVNDSGTWKTASTHCALVKGK